MTEPALESLPTSELVALVRDLQAALVHAQARIAALEAELATLRSGRPPRTTAANSARPPAQGGKARRPAPPAGAAHPKRGPPPGHPGASRARVPTDQVQVLPCRPTTCAHCGGAVPAAGGVVVGRRPMTDRPPVPPVVVEAQRWRVRCRRGGHGTGGVYPDGVGGTGAFGPRLVATTALLPEEQHVASARLVDLLGSLWGLTVSEGALVAAVGRLGQALAPAAAAMAAAVRTAAVLGADETSARVAGVNWWEWGVQTEPAASHTVQRRRTTEVVLRFLAGAPPGVWVSDLWQPPLNAPAVQDQICRAQQLRDLTDAAQAETGAARAAARAGAGAKAARLRAAIHPRHQHAAGALDVTASAGAVAQSETDCDALPAQPLSYGGSDALQSR